MTTTRTTATLSTLATLALTLAAGQAHGAVTWLSGAPAIPDYYQHQLANQGRAASPNPLPVPTDAVPGGGANYDQTKFWWEGYTDMGGVRRGGGWCATTGWLDAIGYWDRNGYAGLVDRTAQGGAHAGKTWIEQFTYSNSALALTADATDGACAWTDSVRSYVRANTVTAARPAGIDPLITRYMWKGGGVKNITSAENLDGAPVGYLTGAATNFGGMLDVLRFSVAQGYTATIKINQSDTSADNNGNWWRNFHVLTLAGFENGPNNVTTVYLADPNDSRVNGTTADGWGVPYPAGHAFPVGQAYYGSFTLSPDGNTITSGAYAGCAIDQIYLMKVPAPGSAALAGLGMLVATRRRR